MTEPDGFKLQVKLFCLQAPLGLYGLKDRVNLT